jgi:PAS domain S-box-containing protein
MTKSRSSSLPGQEKYYKHLTRRNTFLTLIIFVTPFLLMFFILNYEISSLIKNQIYNHLSESVDENIKTINTFLIDRKADLKSYSKLNIEEAHQSVQYADFLNSLIMQKKWYNFLIIADLDGDVILSLNTDVKRNISQREYFRTSTQGQAYNSGIFYSDILNEPVMILSHPLLNKKDKTVGILAASINLDNFYDLLFDLRMGDTSELFLVNKEGLLLSPTRLGGKPLTDMGHSGEIDNPHTGQEGVKTHYDYRGKKVLCAYRKFPGQDFYIASEIDLEEAMLPVKELNRIIIFIFVPFFVLIILLSGFYSRRTTSLLRHLTKDLKNSEEYVRNLIDSISMGVIGLDKSGIIIHYNTEFKNLFGIKNLKKGDNLYSLLPSLNQKEIKDAFHKTKTEASPQHINEKEISIDDREEYMNFSFFPIGTEKNILGVTLLIENVTERKRLRKQLAEYEKLSALSQLALGAAHEINNPLLGISSYLENLQEEIKDNESKKEIGLVLENAYRISETVRGLLSFARPTPPQYTKVNLNLLIEETLSFISHQPIFRKVDVEKALSSSVPNITADHNQLRQVLINIFLNAAQSMPDGGKLKVSSAKVKFKEQVQIDIMDTGKGISPKNLKKIFDPFFTTKKAKGTGLGLSISLSYIKNHHGDIFVHSELNKGTTFSIFLPIRQKGKKSERSEETIS